MLEFRDVSLSYPHHRGVVHAVAGISFAVQEGEIASIIGPSGAGKSTLLHLAAGLLSPDAGQVLLDGITPDPGRVSIGLLTQHYGLLGWKKVRDNILLPLTLRHEKVDEKDLDEIIETLGISLLLDRYPHELSGGQKQRTALARIFLQKPRLLLLDEPFAALDLLTAERSRSLFSAIRDRYPVTTLLVTHNPNEAATLSTRALLLSGSAPGRLTGDFLHPSEQKLRQVLTLA